MSTNHTEAKDLFGIPLPSATWAWSLEVAAGGRDQRRVVERYRSTYSFGCRAWARAPQDVLAGSAADAIQLDDADTAIEGELLDDTYRASSLTHEQVNYQKTLANIPQRGAIYTLCIKCQGLTRSLTRSSYAYGEENLITDAPEYLALGVTEIQRRKAYLHLFARPLCKTLMQRRRELVDSYFIGSDVWVSRRLVACGLSPPS